MLQGLPAALHPGRTGWRPHSPRALGKAHSGTRVRSAKSLTPSLFLINLPSHRCTDGFICKDRQWLHFAYNDTAIAALRPIAELKEVLTMDHDAPNKERPDSRPQLVARNPMLKRAFSTV